MSAMDHLIEAGDEQYQAAVLEFGLIDAQNYCNKFNAACIAVTGFEATISHRLKRLHDTFVAPIDNISVLTH